MTIPSEVWIGLVELTGPPENPILSGSIGAFSNYLCICSEPGDFRRAAEEAAAELGLTVTAVKWTAPVRNKERSGDLDEYLLELAADVAKTGTGCFGVFHAWDGEE